MKKVILILFVILMVTLTSCSKVDKDIITKIEPISEINVTLNDTSADIENITVSQNITDIPKKEIVKANQNGVVVILGTYNWNQLDADRGLLGRINITITNEDSDTFTPDVVVVLYQGQIDPKDRATKSIKMNDVKLAKGDSIERELNVDLPFSNLGAEQNLIIYVYDAFSMPKQLLVTLETQVKFE